LEQTHFELHQFKEKGQQHQSEANGQVKQELAETKAKLQETEKLLQESQSQKETEEFKAKWQETQQKLDKTKSEFHDVREELERSQSQLDEVLGELEQTHFELHQFKEKGQQHQSEANGQVKQELAETKAKLQETEQLLEESQSQLGEMMGVLEEYKSQMEQTMGALEESQGKLQQKHEELEQVKGELAEKQLGVESELHKELEETKSQWRETEELLEKYQSQLEETMATLEESLSQLDSNQKELEQTKFELHQVQQTAKKTQPSGFLYQKIISIDSSCQEAHQKIQELSKTNKEQIDYSDESRLFKINNAVVKPIEIKSNYEWMGGVCFPENMPGVFRHRRSGKLVGKNEPIYIDRPEIVDNSKEVNVIDNSKNQTYSSNFYQGTYIYAGPLIFHFGHVLTESIHRIWAFNPKLHDGLVFALPVGSNSASFNPPQWLIQILKIFNISLEKCIFVIYNCTFENLIIPEPGSELSVGVKEWYCSYLERLQQRILEMTNQLRKEKQDLKLFFGRSHILLRGGVAGEKYLENCLLNEGYVSIQPENYNILEQLSYLISAKKIIFVEGSAIYLLEFLSYLEADIVCIPRRGNNVNFYPHIYNKCSNYIIAGGVDNAMRLGAYNTKDAPYSISIAKNPFQIVESLRNQNFAILENWREDDFLAQENSDVMAYIDRGSKLLKNQNKVYCLAVKEKYLKMRTTLKDNSISNIFESKEITTRDGRLNQLATINESFRYLEIGVSEGKTFNAINIKSKVAVDPKFQFNTGEYATENINFLEVASDDFFRNYAQEYTPFDLIYLDGLHTFEQSFRDFCASIACSHLKTIWLIDDTFPGSYAQAQSSHQRCISLKKVSGEKNKSWMGDVFKVIAAIHDFFPQYSFAHFPHHGQTVVWSKWRENFRPKWNCLETISRLEYSDFLELQTSLFKREPYENIFERIKKDLN
ncbi:MAG: glycosyltransferase 61 family protein, partial [Trichodesmium sp. St4_bin8_1]|nr:glycosyltransferase 61 family protein [Trichodesmium sp. St4_bin8_1]